MTDKRVIGRVCYKLGAKNSYIHTFIFQVSGKCIAYYLIMCFQRDDDSLSTLLHNGHGNPVNLTDGCSILTWDLNLSS